MSMDEMTQQNAALVEEAAAASRAMQDQAESLALQIGFFRTQGHTASAAPTPAKAVKPAASAAGKTAATKPAQHASSVDATAAQPSSPAVEAKAKAKPVDSESGRAHV